VGLLVGFAALGLLIVVVVGIWRSTKGGKTADSNQVGMKSNEERPIATKSNQNRPWIDAAKGPTRIGKFEVEVTHWRFGKVTARGKSGGGDVVSWSDDQDCVVVLKITNTLSTEALEFPGLSKIFGISLTDNLGESHGRLILSGDRFNSKWDEEFYGTAIQPGETVRDALAFLTPEKYMQKGPARPPDPVPDYLNLEIPGKAFGVQESLRLQIPGSLLRRD
jgi:hypothetical protein